MYKRKTFLSISAHMTACRTLSFISFCCCDKLDMYSVFGVVGKRKGN